MDITIPLENWIAEHLMIKTAENWFTVPTSSEN